jgi:hypothetical protein
MIVFSLRETGNAPLEQRHWLCAFFYVRLPRASRPIDIRPAVPLYLTVTSFVSKNAIFRQLGKPVEFIEDCPKYNDNIEINKKRNPRFESCRSIIFTKAMITRT